MCHHQLTVPYFFLHDKSAVIVVLVSFHAAAGMKSLQLILIHLTKYSYYRIDITDYYINIF